MRILTGAEVTGIEPGRLRLTLADGYSGLIDFTGPLVARLLILRPGGLRQERTWSLGDGTARDRLSAPADIPFAVIEDEAKITATTDRYRLDIQRAPFRIDWFFRAAADAAWVQVAADRATRPYQFDREGTAFRHHQRRDRAERHYGLGDKTGPLDKTGRRLRLATSDALGYDAEHSDPLYKHWPFYLAADHGRGTAVGLFYDNLARGTVDFGQEIDAYHGDYRSFEAVDGDLDLYVLFGADTAAVTAGFVGLTGGTAFPPRWSLGYSGSTMQYTDAEAPEPLFDDFVDLVHRHGIPCASFHLSSGYSMHGGRRYVFTWNYQKFPDPSAFVARLAAAGIHLLPNIKPALLLDHPDFAAIAAAGGFVRDADDPARPHIIQFWGGEAAYLDFTNPAGAGWWYEKVGSTLLAHGMAGTWNDNNEFEIDDDAVCAAGPAAMLRPVLTNLMVATSWAAQVAARPALRPYLVTRSGGPGVQRHAQTWTGDNFTAWKTLRHNLSMGLGLSLSGYYNFGHDVGGFAGPRPEPELFMRWIEQGIFWPRFSIHSWNDDGSANEPWMYPELLPLVRAAMALRERLVPFLYDLLWRAHARHEAMVRPLFQAFPDDIRARDVEDCFLLGDRLLVAPVLEPGLDRRDVYLPACAEGWYDFHDGRCLPGGMTVTAAAPLGRCPLFVRGGTILPLGPAPSRTSGPLTLRCYPGPARLALYDDDGETAGGAVAWLHAAGSGATDLRVSCTDVPRWPDLVIENEKGVIMRRLASADLPAA
jgi:alpha-glucosidase